MNAQDGAQLCIQTGHAANVTTLAFSPDGRLLASADDKSTVLIWHLPTNGQMSTLRLPKKYTLEAITTLLFSRDSLLYIGSTHALYVWNISSGKWVYNDTLVGGVNSLTPDPDNSSRIWVSGVNLFQFNEKTCELLRHPEFTSIVNICHQKSEYLFVNQYGSVYETDKDLKVKHISRAVYPERRFKRIRNHFDKQIIRANHKLNRRSNKLQRTETGPSLRKIKKSSALLSRARDKFGMIVKKMKTDSRIAGVDLNPEKKILYTVYKNKIRAVNWRSGKKIFVTSGTYNDDDFRSVNFIPSAHKLIASSADGCIYLLNPVSGKIEHKLRGHLSAVNATNLSPDGATIASGSDDRSLLLWGTDDFKSYKRLYSRAFPITSLSVSSDEKKIIYGNELGFVGVFDRGTPQLNLKTIQAHTHAVRDLVYISSNGTVLSGGDDNRMVLSDVANHRILKKKRFRFNVSVNTLLNNFLWKVGFYIEPYCVVDSMRLSRNEKFVLVHGTRKNIMRPVFRKYDYVFDTEKLKRRKTGKAEWGLPAGRIRKDTNVLCSVSVYNTLNGHSDRISAFYWDKNTNELITASLDATIKIWDVGTGKLKLTVVPVDKNKKVLITPEDYYYASRDALDAIGFRSGTDFFPAAAFDLTYNRPDKVLAALDFPDDLTEIYLLAWQKRVLKAGLKGEGRKAGYHIPTVSLVNKAMLAGVNNEKYIKLQVTAEDKDYPLSLIRVQINGVTVAEVNCGNRHLFENIVQIKLSEGTNQIRVTSVNAEGAESVAENLKIRFEEKQKPDLYVIAIGVSDYADETKNLRYAVKDGRDLALAMKSFSQGGKHSLFNHVYLDTLFNREATKENILFLKQKLMQSNVDDQVILYVSGHGLLDDSLDFYFATWDMIFEKPAINGIPYEALEGLLNDIPARKKLMLMDACHSGELDRNELVKPADTLTLEKLLQQQGSKGVTAVRKGRIGLTNSYELMQELFAGMSSRSGAVVISTATGYGFALEGENWNNGAFTHCLLKGLKDKAADQNDDGKITVSELRKYVTDEVPILTEGRQKPTCRQDNVLFDFRLR